MCGQGDHFMNGHDMNMYIGSPTAVQEKIYHKVQFFNHTVLELQGMDRPVIAAVKGRVSGAGLSLMLASDLVIAAHGTVFNSDYIPYAMVPDGGTAFFLARKMARRKPARFCCSVKILRAEQAESWGLVNRVVAGDALQAEATAWATKLATGATRTLGMTKRLIAKAFEQDLNAHLGVEAACVATNTKSLDFAEAMKAFSAKRPAKFIGG